MKNKIKRYLILALVIIVVIVVVVVAIKVALQPRKNAEIITAASLEKIIDVEELSTLQVHYEGDHSFHNADAGSEAAASRRLLVCGSGAGNPGNGGCHHTEGRAAPHHCSQQKICESCL